MGEIDIAYHLVREKTDRLAKKQQTEFEGGIKKHFDTLENVFQKTCGDGIDAVMDCLWDEKKTLQEISGMMNELLSYLRDATDTFEDADISCGEALKNVE